MTTPREMKGTKKIEFAPKKRLENLLKIETKCDTDVLVKQLESDFDEKTSLPSLSPPKENCNQDDEPKEERPKDADKNDAG